MSRSSVVVAAALFACSAQAGAQIAACGTIAPSLKIVEVGAFSDMRYTEEHAYGHTVMLWRAGDCVFGLLEYSAGMAGDAPIGALQDVKYDANTGALTFAAKLTTGMVSFRGSNGDQPARDLFQFRGTLRPTRLTGTMTHALQNNPQLTPETNSVTLVPSKDAAEFMHGPTTWAQWQTQWQPILSRRGPKWQ